MFNKHSIVFIEHGTVFIKHGTMFIKHGTMFNEHENQLSGRFGTLCGDRNRVPLAWKTLTDGTLERTGPDFP